jgi:hypothetical protein
LIRAGSLFKLNGMGIAQWAGDIDAVGGLAQVARRFRRGAAEGLSAIPSIGGLGSIEAKLAGVVVAALKEAFDRDSARLELERSQLDAERRRAEEALRAELHRQAVDRLVGQLRLVAIVAVVTWALSAALGVWMPGMRETLPRVLLATGWLFALGSLGATFAAWQHLSLRGLSSGSAPKSIYHPAVTYAPWLLLMALALTGAGLLIAL